MSIPQKTINYEPAPGIAGQFCSANPRYSMLADSGSLRAGTAGVTLGLFARAKNSDGTVTNAHPGVASRLGFALRDNMGLIPTIPFVSGNSIPAGYEVSLLADGDVWMLFAAGATIGQKVFASYADGSAVAGTAGSAPTATLTANTTSGSANLASVSTAVYAGEPVSGTGIPAGAYIVTGAAIGGTAVMSANATATGTGVTVTRTTAQESNWYIAQTVAAGEVAKTSTKG